MKKKYSVPVNYFEKNREVELHGLLNGIPAFVLFTFAFISYYLYPMEITIGLVLIGMLWIIFFVVLTYLYSNARLYVREEGLVLKKGKQERLFKWEEIKALEFAAMKGGKEPTIPPIKLSLLADEEITIYLYKIRFKTPLFIYYKLLSLIGCISSGRKLLPDKLEQIHT